MAPDIIFEALTCKSVTDIKLIVKKAIQKQRDENNQIQQLSQQVEQLQSELKKASQELKASEEKIATLNSDKLQLQQQEINMKYQIEWYKAQTDRNYKEATAEEQKRRTQVEIMQQYDNNPYNDKIRDL